MTNPDDVERRVEQLAGYLVGEYHDADAEFVRGLAVQLAIARAVIYKLSAIADDLAAVDWLKTTLTDAERAWLADSMEHCAWCGRYWAAHTDLEGVRHRRLVETYMGVSR